MSLEQTTQKDLDIMPQYATLSDTKRPGFKEFDIEDFDLSDDLIHRVSVELSGGPSANFLQPADDSTEQLSHDTFEADLRQVPYVFNGLHATTSLLSRVTAHMRGFSKVMPDFATRDANNQLVPHTGLADWEPSHVQLERYTVNSPIEETPPPREFYHGEDTDRVASVIIPLRGQARIEFDTNGAFNQFAALEVGKLAVIRAAGLLPGTGELGPGYRTAGVSGHVALILRNRLGEGSVPAEITFDRSREERAEAALGNVTNPGWRILRSLGVTGN